MKFDIANVTDVESITIIQLVEEVGKQIVEIDEDFFLDSGASIRWHSVANLALMTFHSEHGLSLSLMSDCPMDSKIHDVMGLIRNWDSENRKMLDCWWPRCAAQ